MGARNLTGEPQLPPHPTLVFEAEALSEPRAQKLAGVHGQQNPRDSLVPVSPVPGIAGGSGLCHSVLETKLLCSGLLYKH